MFKRLIEKFGDWRQSGQWSVAVTNDAIITRDGVGAEHRLALSDFSSAIIATDDGEDGSTDIVFLLHGSDNQTDALFPFDAAGRADFVEYIFNQPGFDEQSLSEAMAATGPGRFIIWERAA